MMSRYLRTRGSWARKLATCVGGVFWGYKRERGAALMPRMSWNMSRTEVEGEGVGEGEGEGEGEGDG